ncbi:hypothetical protein MUP32_02745 [Candidatus Microgenomates bacterium]|nr:hypothetical protein [Candidatus Microgenomates bacterium]
MIGEESARVPLEVCGVGEIWKANPQEPYSVRLFNPNNSDDSQKFGDMRRHPDAVLYSTRPPLKPIELDAAIRGIDFKNIKQLEKKDWDKLKKLLTFAIVDNKGEAVGMINYYEDNAKKKLRKKGLIARGALVLEVSARTLQHKWPKEYEWIEERTNLPDTELRGVALSGLRQTMILVKQMEDAISKEIAITKPAIKARPVYITAYTDPKNIPMEESLEKAGFKKVAHETYDNGEENTWMKEL